MIHRIIPYANVNWDEAGSLIWTYRVVQVLQTQSGSLSQIALDQFYALPGYSFAVGFPLSLIGFSIYQARIVALYIFIVGALTVYMIGRFMDNKYGSWIGLTSLFIFLTSPLMLLFGSIAMKEMISTSLSLLVLLFYMLARDKKSWILFIVSGFFLFLTSMTRYHPAVLVAAGIVAEGFISFLLLKKQRIWVMVSHLLVIGTYVGFTSLWILLPTNKWGWLLSILGNQWEYTSEFAKPFSPAALLFYPRSIVLMYSGSPIIGIGLVLAFISFFLFWRNYKMRILWLPVFLNLLYATHHVINMEERFIFSVVPFLFILAATTGIYFIEKMHSVSKKYPQLGVGFGVLVILFVVTMYDLFFVFHRVYAAGAYIAKSPLFNQTDYQDLWFDYDTRKWSWNLPPQEQSKPADVMSFVMEAIDPNKYIQLYGLSNEFSQWYFDLSVLLEKDKKKIVTDNFSSYVIVIRIDPTSRFSTRDNLLYNTIRHPENVPPSVPPSAWISIKSKYFAELGLNAEVYGVY